MAKAWVYPETHKGGSRGWKVQYRKPDGKMTTQHFNRKKQADAFRSSIETDLLKGDYRDPRLAEHTLTWFLDEVWEPSLGDNPNTRHDYLSMRRTWIDRLGALKLNACTPSRCENVLKAMETIGRSPKRVKKVQTLMHMMFDLAERDGYIAANPMRRVRRRHAQGLGEAEFRVPTTEEVDEIADAIQRPSDRVLVLLLGYCGLRWGEAAGLLRGRVDPLRRRLTITETLSEVNGRLHERRPTKGRRSRVVVLPDFLVTELACLLEDVRQAPNAYVFTTASGGPMRNSNFRRRTWLPALEAAGIEPFRLHDLRHHAASRLLAEGVPLPAVAKVLGHSSPAVTARVYSHAFEDDLEDAAAVMDRARRRGENRSSGAVGA